MKKLLLMLFAAAQAFVSRAGENDDLWLYWTVDSTESGIEFYGANLYVVENGEGHLVGSTKWANSAAPVTTLSGANEFGQGDQDCSLCLMSDISGVGIGAAFYVELVNAAGETVGWWKGGYMSMESLTTVHEALDGMVSGLQTKEPFQHVHGGEWVASSFLMPEPSGGLLMLVGMALLALRRRKAS